EKDGWGSPDAAAFYASNCNARGATKRTDLVRELMQQGLTVHSYGDCLHNK
ncbi:unnamed protein product, partial [Discosporangium mesarthrocarpum]